ncbi:hypothetical protein Tco_1360301 [Tanacetum coccineum]
MEVCSRGMTGPPKGEIMLRGLFLSISSRSHLCVYLFESYREPNSDEEDKEEEHLAPANSTIVASPVVDLVPSTEEIEPFETDESAATLPPPAHHTTSRIADITEADMPPQKRVILTAPTPRFDVGESSAAAAARQPGSTMVCRDDYSFIDTMDASIRDSERRTMAAIEVVNLRVSYQADVCRRESEIKVLRRERLAYEQESSETRQALARSEAHNKALEVQIEVLETQAYCHEWQRQDADDHATRHIMRTQALEAGARVDTLEDTAKCLASEMEGKGVGGSKQNPTKNQDTFVTKRELEEEFNERARLAKSKRFFNRGLKGSLVQRKLMKLNSINMRFARDCFLKTSVPSYLSPFQNNTQPKFFSSSQQKPKLRPTKDFEAKYNKVKAKQALLGSSALTSKSSMVLKALVDDENVVVGKESDKNSEWVKISMRKSSTDDTKVSIPGVERPWLSKAEGFNLPNHDTGRILPAESQLKVTNSSVIVTDSSVTDYDLTDQSLVCSTPLLPLEKLVGVEPVSGPKTIQKNLKSNSTFKAETLKSVTINEPTSTHAKGNKKVSASKINSAPAGKLKNVKSEDDISLSVLHKLQRISAFVDSRLESIEQFLNNFANHPNETNMNDLEFNDELVDTPLVSPFPHSDNDSDDGEVLNELFEYENVGMLRREKAINSFDGDDLAFQCMIGFRKFVAYFDPFLPINIIMRKAYNTIMVKELESTEKRLVAIVRDVYVFIGSFTYITDFVVLKDIGEFSLIDKAEVMMGKPFRKITILEYDCAKGLMSFSRIFDNYTFQMPRIILKFKRWGHVSWSKIPPILVLSQRDLTNGFKNVYEKNKLMYKNCLNLGPEYQVDESMKEWLIHGHVSIHEVTKFLIKNEKEIFTDAGDGVRIIPDGIAPPAINIHTITGRNDIKWFRRGEALQAKKVESSNANRSKTPTMSGCSRHMTGVKSYLHKYVEQPGPKMVFGDDSTCTTEGYGSIKFDGINIAETKRYPPDEYLHPFKPSQRYQVDSNVVKYIEPYEKLKHVSDHHVQVDKILNDDQSEHSNHTNDEHIIDNPTNTEYVQITEPSSSLTKDASAPNAVLTIQTESPSSNLWPL